MKKSLINLSMAILLMLPVAGFAATGQIIKSNGLNTGFANFSAPVGQYISKLDGYWSGGWGYITAYANGGSSADIMVTQDAALFFSILTVSGGNHITRIGPDGADYLGVWTEAGLLGDVIWNSGSAATWLFSNFTAPAGEVITGFTSSSSGGFAYLYAVSSCLPLPVNAGVDQTVCVGIAVTLSGSGATSYTWDNGVSNGVPFTPAVGSLTYTVTGTTGSCSNTDHVVVTVNALPTVNAGVDQTVCAGIAVTLSGSGATSYTWDNGVTNGTPFTPLSTTTYTVTGTDNGCQNTDQVLVTVNSVDNYTVSVIDPTASVTALVGATYQWLNCDNGNANIPGATNTDYTATVNGNYGVVVTQNGCTSTSSCVYIIAVGISQNQISFIAKVYPNPSTGIFNTEGNNINSVEITDITGRLIKKFNVHEQEIKIDLSNEPKGVYFLKAYTGSTIKVQKLILK